LHKLEQVAALAGQSLLNELTAQAAVAAHPNVVKVLGAVANGAKGFGLLFELATKGSLHALLHERREIIDWPTRVLV